MELQLRNMRKRANLTQAALAEEIGTTLRVVSAWERNETPLGLDDAVRIADFFGCTLDELAGREAPTLVDTLASDEMALISDYRMLTQREQNAVRQTASTMADSGHAKSSGLRIAESA